jgi:hypothetical protein
MSFLKKVQKKECIRILFLDNQSVLYRLDYAHVHHFFENAISTILKNFTPLE